MDWTWIGVEGREELLIPSSTILVGHPEWYKPDDRQEADNNCLVFDRVGHDLPILVPSNCQLRKPFICSRVGELNQTQRFHHPFHCAFFILSLMIF